VEWTVMATAAVGTAVAAALVEEAAEEQAVRQWQKSLTHRLRRAPECY